MSAHFVTPDGCEMAATTRDQMREIDRIAVEETGPSLAQMMENAGRSLATLALTRLEVDTRAKNPPRTRVIVVAGTGGNGGGGICAARHLAARLAYVELCLTRPAELSAMAAQQLEIFRQTSGQLVGLDALEAQMPYALVIDAVLGYGLTGSPRGEAERAIQWITDSGVDVLALDIPSGVDATSGDTPGVHVVASATLTLHMPKPGLMNPVAGHLFVADLGIPSAVTRRVGLAAPHYGTGSITPLARAG